MNKITTLILFVLTSSLVFAAGEIRFDNGIISKGAISVGNSTSADAKSLLDIRSTSKVALLPRMTTAQKTAIASPPEGSIVFDTDLDTYSQYTGSAWLNIATITGTETLTNKSMSGASNTFTNIPNSATTAASANTASAIVARDGSGNFSAGTISAALTGTASGNTTYTPNQYGVVVSGSANTMSVIAPDASTTKVLTSGGASANPSWQDPAAAPSSSIELSNLGLSATIVSNELVVALKTQAGSDPSAGSPVKVGFRDATLTTGTYNQRSITGALSITLATTTSLGLKSSGTVSFIYIYLVDNGGAITMAASAQGWWNEAQLHTTSTTATSNAVIYQGSALANKPIRLIGVVKAEWTNPNWANIAEVAVQPLKPVAMGFKASGATTTVDASEIIINGTVVKDALNMYNASTGVATIPKSGLWAVAAGAELSSTAWTAGQRVGLNLTGTTSYQLYREIIQASTTREITMTSGARILPFTVGDTVSVTGVNNGTAAALSGTSTSYFEMIYVGDMVGF